MYLTTRQVADRLQLTPGRIVQMCAEGRIKGAFQTGGQSGQWRIPADCIISQGQKMQRPISASRSVVDHSIIERLKQKCR